MISLPGYQTTDILYEGYRSRVYRALRLDDGQAVVLKVMRQTQPTAQDIADFKREYAMIRRFNTDGIIKAYSLEPYQDGMLMIFEDFGGQSLKQVISQYQLTLPQFFHLAIRITEILEEVHQKHIIHRDINPANILVLQSAQADKAWLVKLIDFGLALRLLPENPQGVTTNILEGTPAYIAPEQTGRINRPFDYRADFYALGVTFYEMLVGHLPFIAQDEVEIIHAHVAQTPKSPHELNPDIPIQLSDIVMKLLQKEAEKRYQDAKAIRLALVDCLQTTNSGNPVTRFKLSEMKVDSSPKPKSTIDLESTRRGHSEAFDFVSLTKALQVISSEMQLDNLLIKMIQIVMECGGAERCLLILDETGQWTLVAEGVIGISPRLFMPPQPLTQANQSRLPMTVLNHVARTQESVVVDNISKENQFATDPYVVEKSPKSALCLPMLNQGKLIGMLYLENNLTSGAFTSHRLTVLNLLAVQAAVSIENARLYSALADYNRTLEQQVATRTQEGLLAVRQKLSQAQADFEWWRQMLIENLPHPIYVKDTEQRFFMANQPAALLRGQTSPDTLLGKTEIDFFPARLVADYQSDEARLLQTGEPLLDYEERLIDQTTGKERWFSSTKVAVKKDNQIVGLLGVSQDITQRKQTEKKLRDSVENFEDAIFINHFVERMIQRKVKERTEELSHTLDYLKAVQEELIQAEKMAALGSLVAGIAHEINTPLGVGVTAASGLQDKTESLQTTYQTGQLTRGDLEKYLDKATQLSTMILVNLNRAAELIGSFKQVAVDQSTEARRPFKVREYLEEILLSLNPELKRTQHQVTLMIDPDLIIDNYPGAFAQIVTNLIMNSLTHAYQPDEAGQITLHIEQQNNHLLFRYSDDGCGIPAENLSHIFEPFFTTKRGQGGSGLGLPIIYNLITQKLTGTIRCESEPNQGATFIIDLPI